MGPLFFVFFMKEITQADILSLAEPLVAAQGLKIWGLELVGKPPIKAVLYVEAPKDGEPPTIDQCEEISRQLGLALDVEDNFPGSWTLEVSTPGLDRKFFTLEQMRPYAGDMVEAVLLEPMEGRKKFRGRLLETGEDYFKIEPCQIGENGEILPEKLPPVTIPWNKARHAHRLYVFTPPQKPGKGPGKKRG